ncbi:MAG: N-methyl-L-tryptophan oxidase [Hyphomonas sp.]
MSGTFRQCELAVLGLGAMGLSALHAAARRGVDVIGIDRFTPPHDKGSTHGETRLIREAYSEDARYIPLLRRAMALWREWAATFGGEVYHETGVQYFGPADHPDIRAVRASADAYDIPLLRESTEAPGFDVPAGWDHFHELCGGYLAVEDVLAKLLARGKALGATVRTGKAIHRTVHENGRWRLDMEDETIHAARVIFTPGPWAAELIPDLAPHLVLERHTQHWLEAPADSRFTRAAGFRPFVAHLPGGEMYYGFPQDAAGLVKIAEHCHGRRFQRWEEMDRAITDADRAPILAFRNRHAPDLGPIRRSVSCMYTMSPDGHFILGRHPADVRSALLAGLSGHGYKFAPVMGDILLALALGEDPGFDLTLFSPGRFTGTKGSGGPASGAKH